jgi:hypothetical protein
VKNILLAFAMVLYATPASARIAPAWPAPIEEAPIDRAIENVEADRNLTDAQRARLLGRLHLIGYAQGDVRMKRYANGEWAPGDQAPCDPSYRRPRGFWCYAAPRELPLAVGRANRAGLAHLRAARAHYARAVAMDGNVLRARLGLAYALDESKREEEAREQLREIIAIGLPLLQREWSEPEDHAIMFEAVEHLSVLAHSGADQQSIERVRARLGASPPAILITPIVVPLADAPFEQMIDRASPVAFDFGGIGDRRARGWLTANAAWLVWDPEQRAQIRTGFQLIGQRAWGVFWTDGFEALRALDDDRDGELAGPELDGLAIWRDANADGVSQSDEVRKLAAHGVVALSTRGAVKRPDLIVAPAGVRLRSGRTRPLYDWTPDANATPIS